jgi:ankyrin repeat protein
MQEEVFLNLNWNFIRSLFNLDLGYTNNKPDIFQAVAESCLDNRKLGEVRKMILSDASLIHARQGSNGSTPLFIACMWGDTRTAQLLIDYGANVNVRNFRGETPLHAATWEGKLNAMLLLIREGAYLEMPSTPARKTALHEAVYKGNIETIKLLLENGAFINPEDADGYTPLHYACRNGTDNIAVFLLASGADAGVKDADGYTPLKYAIENEMEVVVTWYRVHHTEIYEEELARAKDAQNEERGTGFFVSP